MPPKRKRSALWKHFVEIGGKKAKCRHCDVVISFVGGSNGNLTRHIRAKHPHILASLEAPEYLDESGRAVEELTKAQIKDQPWTQTGLESIVPMHKEQMEMDSEEAHNVPQVSTIVQCADLDDFNEETITSETFEETNFEEEIHPSSIKKVILKRSPLSRDEKHVLATEVGIRPLIWDVTHRQHTNSMALASAWNEIAGRLNRSAEDCKAAWATLRDAKRYRQRVLHKEFEAAGGECISSSHIEHDDDWEYAEDLTFLPVSLRTGASLRTRAHEMRNSNYCYTGYSTPSAHRSQTDLTGNTGESSQIVQNAKQSNYKYPEVWANLDRMISKLNNDEKAEEIFMEFQTIAYQALKEAK